MAVFASLLLLITLLSWRSEAFSPLGALPYRRRHLKRTIVSSHRQHLQLHLSSDNRCTDGADNVDDVPLPLRRTLIATVATTLLTTTALPLSSFADDNTAALYQDRIFVKGIATLQAGLSTEEIGGPDSAIYVTARPNKPDNVPRAILDGSRGKPPPVLSARFPNVSSFPFEFSLTSQNFTPEGASKVEGRDGDNDDVWWANEDLIVSARLDSDGVAATRDPTDLVGRGIYSAKGGADVTVELQGRGLFGKSVTAKK